MALLPQLTPPLLASLLIVHLGPSLSLTNEVQVPGFWLAPGVQVEVVAEKFGEAGMMEFGPDGTLFVAQPGVGMIKTLRPNDGKYVEVAVFAKGYPTVQALSYADGYLWFATSSAIYRARDRHGDGIADDIVPIVENLTVDSRGSRALLVTRDAILTSNTPGSPSAPDADAGQILKFSLDGKSRSIWSPEGTGLVKLRQGFEDSNTYGLYLGDREGVASKFSLLAVKGPQKNPDAVKPVATFAVPGNARGFALLTRGARKGDALVSLRGESSGNRIDLVKLGRAPITVETLVRLAGPGGELLGRPVDIAQSSDGNIYFSEDYGNRIYRLKWMGH